MLITESHMRWKRREQDRDLFDRKASVKKSMGAIKQVLGERKKERAALKVANQLDDAQFVEK
jgi:SET domain-containing protein